MRTEDVPRYDTCHYWKVTRYERMPYASLPATVQGELVFTDWHNVVDQVKIAVGLNSLKYAKPRSDTLVFIHNDGYAVIVTYHPDPDCN